MIIESPHRESVLGAALHYISKESVFIVLGVSKIIFTF